MELRDIKFQSGDLQVLKNINLEFYNDDLVALLGTSGAGKTTLLNLCSGRVNNQSIGLYSGSFCLGSNKIRKVSLENMSILKNNTGYVFQHEVLPTDVTIAEYLYFILCLIRPKTNTDQIDISFHSTINTSTNIYSIKIILDELKLDGVKLIGNLSGGQMKKVAIAVEMLRYNALKDIKDFNSIVFFDEPTTGLDNATAYSVMNIIKNIDGLKVCTIHQPTYKILNLFDRIIVLHQGMIFFDGSLDKLREKIMYFGFREKHNIMDRLFFDILSKSSFHNGKWMLIANGKFFIFPSSVKINIKKNKMKKELNILKIKGRRANIKDQMLSLIIRILLRYYNNPFLLFSKVIQAFISGIILGFVFYKLNNPQLDVLNRQIEGFLYSSTSSNFYSVAMPSITLIYQNFNLFLREYNQNLYSMNIYFFSIIFEGIFSMSCVPLITTPLMLYFTKLRINFTGFIIYLLANWLIAMNGMAMATIFGGIFSNKQYAQIALTLCLFPLSTISGQFVAPDRLISPIKYLQYISPTRLGYNIQIKNFFYQANKINNNDRSRTIDSKNSKLINLRNQFLSIKMSFSLLILLFLWNIFLGLMFFRRRVKKKL